MSGIGQTGGIGQFQPIDFGAEGPEEATQAPVQQEATQQAPLAAGPSPMQLNRTLADLLSNSLQQILQGTDMIMKYAAPFPGPDQGAAVMKYGAPFPGPDNPPVATKYGAPWPGTTDQATQDVDIMPMYAAPWPGLDQTPEIDILPVYGVPFPNPDGGGEAPEIVPMYAAPWRG